MLSPTTPGNIFLRRVVKRQTSSNVVNSKPPLCVPDANLQRQKWFESLNSMSFFSTFRMEPFFGKLKTIPKDVETIFFK